METAAAEARLREAALALPEAFEQERWGIPVFKLPPNSLFLMLSATGETPVRATVKLSAEEREVALTLPWCHVARYVGRYGWVTGDAVDEDALAAMVEWIVESYWLRAPARLRALVEASPAWGA